MTLVITSVTLQYIPRNMHTVFALLCVVVVIHWLIFPYPSGLLHWHCGNLTIAPVPAKQPWWIWINTSCEFIMNDCITTTKQSTTKPCAYFLGYTVYHSNYDLGHFDIYVMELCQPPIEQVIKNYIESVKTTSIYVISIITARTRWNQRVQVYINGCGIEWQYLSSITGNRIQHIYKLKS